MQSNSVLHVRGLFSAGGEQIQPEDPCLQLDLPVPPLRQGSQTHTVGRSASASSSAFSGGELPLTCSFLVSCIHRNPRQLVKSTKLPYHDNTNYRSRKRRVGQSGNAACGPRTKRSSACTTLLESADSRAEPPPRNARGPSGKMQNRGGVQFATRQQELGQSKGNSASHERKLTTSSLQLPGP